MISAERLQEAHERPTSARESVEDRSHPPGAAGALRVCRLCKRSLPLDHFQKSNSTTDGLRTDCCDCRRDHDRELREGQAFPRHTHEDLRYLPLEHVMEELSSNELARVWKVSRDKAISMRREPWAHVGTKYEVDDHRDRQLRDYLEGATA